MLSEKITPASHVGEEQSSPDVFADRKAYWANTQLGLSNAQRATSSTSAVAGGVQ